MKMSDIAKILKGTMGNSFPKTDITVSVVSNVGNEQVWVTVYSVPPKSSQLDQANASHKARFVLQSTEKLGKGEDIPGKVQIENMWKRKDTPFRKSKADPTKSIEKVMDFFLKYREKFTPDGGKKATTMNIDLEIRTAATLPKGSKQRRDILERITVAKEAASKDPVDVAVEIISRGMKHPALTAITAKIGKVEKALAKAKTDQSSLRSVGGGDANAINFLKDAQKEIKKLRDVISKVIIQLDTRVFKAASE